MVALMPERTLALVVQQSHFRALRGPNPFQPLAPAVGVKGDLPRLSVDCIIHNVVPSCWSQMGILRHDVIELELLVPGKPRNCADS